MSDPLCDRCHQEYPLTLTVKYRMLCALCMEREFEYSLQESLEAKEAFEMKKAAMKAIWKEINKGDKK
mgnify:CR=1 FL=1